MRGQNSQDPGLIVHPQFGPALPQQGWVPAPRYILRRARVLEHMQRLQPRSVLDIGCGPGALLYELAQRGIESHGLETSEHALAIGSAMHQASNVALYRSPGRDWNEKFELVTAFEVLEHIEKDVAALAEWRRWIVPGGYIMISVPAHPRLYNAADVWAGHVRRYRRDELHEKLVHAEFDVERIECYGFPLANVMEVMRALVYSHQLKKQKRSPDKGDAERTAQSGSDRTAESRFWPVLSSPFAVSIMRSFERVQSLALSTNLGNGFIAIAKKRL